MLVGKAIAKDLPPGWVMKDKMPAPPLGPDGKRLYWSFDIPSQIWWAKDGKGRALFPLQDSSRKFVLGADFVPGGWEVSGEGLPYVQRMERLGQNKLTATELCVTNVLLM